MGLSTIQYYVYNEQKVELDILRKKVANAIGELPFSIMQSESSHWVGIGFIDDEYFESYEENLNLIYDVLQSTVIGALIFDSDMLALILKIKGADLSDNVGVGRFEPRHKKPKGNLDLWQPLLKKSATVEQLVEAFESEPVFVEEALDDILQLLGMEKSFWSELLTSLIDEN